MSRRELGSTDHVSRSSNGGTQFCEVRFELRNVGNDRPVLAKILELALQGVNVSGDNVLLNGLLSGL